MSYQPVAMIVAHGGSVHSGGRELPLIPLIVVGASFVMLMLWLWLAERRHRRSLASTRNKKTKAALVRTARTRRIASTAVGLLCIGAASALILTAPNAKKGGPVAEPVPVSSPDANERFPFEVLSSNSNGEIRATVSNETNKLATVQCQIAALGPDGASVVTKTFDFIEEDGTVTKQPIYTTRLELPPDGSADIDIHVPVEGSVDEYVTGCDNNIPQD